MKLTALTKKVGLTKNKQLQERVYSKTDLRLEQMATVANKEELLLNHNMVDLKKAQLPEDSLTLKQPF